MALQGESTRRTGIARRHVYRTLIIVLGIALLVFALALVLSSKRAPSCAADADCACPRAAARDYPACEQGRCLCTNAPGHTASTGDPARLSYNFPPVTADGSSETRSKAACSNSGLLACEEPFIIELVSANGSKSSSLAFPLRNNELSQIKVGSLAFDGWPCQLSAPGKFVLPPGGRSPPFIIRCGDSPVYGTLLVSYTLEDGTPKESRITLGPA